MSRSKMGSAMLLLGMIPVVFAIAVPTDVNARTLNVPADFPKVQQAVDAADFGDTVLVAPGRYAPSTNGEVFPIDVKNGVRLLGAGAAICTLDAEETNGVIGCWNLSDTTTRIDGFTITGGSGDRGGGVYCWDSNPTIVDNIITGNRADWCGAGIYCAYSNPTITNNLITGNRSVSVGGGISCSHRSSPTISRNLVSDNSAGGHGGGIFCYNHSAPTITSNVVTGNSVGYYGGGFLCDFYSSPTITNNIVTGNDAGHEGGGFWFSWYCLATITNNIVTGNGAGYAGGGIRCCDYPFPNITYDDVWGNTPDDYSGCGHGGGCISVDPLFVDPAMGDYHLQPRSPCIDKGHNNAPALPQFDFDGNPRILDGDGDGRAIVDMGAFEYAYQVLVTQLTGGGWIPGEPHDPRNKRTFGFNVHSEARAVWGQLQFNDHGTKMKVHSDTMKTLVVQPGDTVADFSGDCRVDGVSGYSFECEIMDRGEPGHGVDWFSIDIYDADGSLYYSAGDFLGGGDIRIHIPDDDIAKGGFESEVEPGHDPNPLLNMAEKTQMLAIGQRPLQNSPNPFSDRTTISLHLPTSGHTILEIYDITGRSVATLVDGKLSAGTYSVTWEKDRKSSRIYFCRLTASDFTVTKKMIALK